MVVRREKLLRKIKHFVYILTAVSLVGLFSETLKGSAISEGGAGGVGVGRRLLSGGGCSCPNIPAWVEQGGVAVHFVGILILFLGLSIICDDFFVPSLEKISDALDLSEDVAGATFMAAGSSAPELFASLMSLLNPSADDSIGIATIVGSAVFNVLVIIGATGALAGKDLVLDWKPLARDALFYGVCVALLLAFVLDGKIYPYEGGILTAGYVCYILYMGVNSRVFTFLDRMFPKWKPAPDTVETKEMDHELWEQTLISPSAAKMQAAVRTTILMKRFIRKTRRQELQTHSPYGEKEEKGGPWSAKSTSETDLTGSEHDPPLTNADSFKVECNPLYGTPSLKKRGSRNNFDYDDSQAETIPTSTSTMQNPGSLPGADPPVPKVAAANEKAGGEEEVENPFKYPAAESVTNKVLWAAALPLYACFVVTVPDCRKPKWERWYVGSFAASIFWIGFLSWFMVEWAGVIGCVLKVPPVAMGITVLAAGTSIPDALGSIAVAKQGQGNMAVSNAIGSNVFDILVGLGFPWLLTSFLRSEGYIEVATGDLEVNIIFLFAVLVIYVGALMWNKLTLTKRIGYSLIGLYGCFVVYTILVTVIDGSGCSSSESPPPPPPLP